MHRICFKSFMIGNIYIYIYIYIPMHTCTTISSMDGKGFSFIRIRKKKISHSFFLVVQTMKRIVGGDVTAITPELRIN